MQGKQPNMRKYLLGSCLGLISVHQSLTLGCSIGSASILTPQSSQDAILAALPLLRGTALFEDQKEITVAATPVNTGWEVSFSAGDGQSKVQMSTVRFDTQGGRIVTLSPDCIDFPLRNNKNALAAEIAFSVLASTTLRSPTRESTYSISVSKANKRFNVMLTRMPRVPGGHYRVEVSDDLSPSRTKVIRGR